MSVVAKGQSSGDISHSDLIHDTFKKARLQSTFDLIAQALIILIVGVLIYYNALMFLPHTIPIAWAILFAIFLHKPLTYISAGLDKVDNIIKPYKMKFFIATVAIYIGLLFTCSLLTILIMTGIFSFWTFLVFGDRGTVSATLLLISICLVVGLPSYWIIMTCVGESQILATKIQQFVDKNKEFQALLDDFGNSYYYKWAHTYAAQWGVELPPFDPEVIKNQIIDISMQFSSHITDALGGIVNVLSGGVQFIVHFVTFISTLLYIILNMDTLTSALSDISPFSDDDSDLLMHSLYKSVTSVFYSSALIGVSHLIGTYIVFAICGVDLALVLSFIAAFMSVMPFIGSWVVWVPAALGKFLLGQHVDCIAIVAVQIVLVGPVDSLIYRMIPGNSFLIGMALAMGMYVFGPLGVVAGPLLSGLVLTIADMYRTYQRLPRLKMKPGTSSIEVGMDQIQRLSAATTNNTAPTTSLSTSGSSHLPLKTSPSSPSVSLSSMPSSPGPLKSQEAVFQMLTIPHTPTPTAAAPAHEQ